MDHTPLDRAQLEHIARLQAEAARFAPAAPAPPPEQVGREWASRFVTLGAALNATGLERRLNDVTVSSTHDASAIRVLRLACDAARAGDGSEAHQRLVETLAGLAADDPNVCERFRRSVVGVMSRLASVIY